MPFSTKSDLETTIATWLARSDSATVSQIPDFIRLAEADIEREVDCVFEDASATGALDGTGILVLPADCIYVRKIWTTGTPSFDWTLISPEESANLAVSMNGLPARYAYRRANTLVYVPLSSDNYAMDYRKSTAKLGTVAGGATTDYLTNLYDLLLYGSLCHAAPFLKADARLPLWSSIYNRLLDGVQRLEWKKRTGGMTLRARPHSWA